MRCPEVAVEAGSKLGRHLDCRLPWWVTSAQLCSSVPTQRTLTTPSVPIGERSCTQGAPTACPVPVHAQLWPLSSLQALIHLHSIPHTSLPLDQNAVCEEDTEPLSWDSGRGHFSDAAGSHTSCRAGREAPTQHRALECQAQQAVACLGADPCGRPTFGGTEWEVRGRAPAGSRPTCKNRELWCLL